MIGQLGRVAPPDWEHVAKYALTADTIPTKPTPAVFGINWYSNFDRPVKTSNRWWIGLGPLGQIRGGHAINAQSSLSDLTAWWQFYNQGNTGECEGYSHSRMMTQLNRARYDAQWLYFEAQDLAGQPRDPNAGTYGRVVLEVLRIQGLKTPAWSEPRLTQGISAYRWATSVDQVHAVLQNPMADKLGAIPLNNSWGPGFPHTVWLPDAVVARLLSEDGECGLVTDR